jgi:hypothetical protein
MQQVAASQRAACGRGRRAGREERALTGDPRLGRRGRGAGGRCRWGGGEGETRSGVRDREVARGSLKGAAWPHICLSSPAAPRPPLTWPMVNLWKRSMSITPTWGGGGGRGRGSGCGSADRAGGTRWRCGRGMGGGRARWGGPAARAPEASARTHLGEAAAVEVGPLVDARRDEQAAWQRGRGGGRGGDAGSASHPRRCQTSQGARKAGACTAPAPRPRPPLDPPMMASLAGEV